MPPYIKRSAIWPDPRVKPPFGAAEIDWGHPLASGLAGLWLCNEAGGDYVRDMVGAAHTVKATAQNWQSTREGLAYRVDAEFPGATGPNLLNMAGSLTLACRWRTALLQNNFGLITKYGFSSGKKSYGLAPTGNTLNRMYVTVGGVDKTADGTVQMHTQNDGVVAFGQFDGSNVLCSLYTTAGDLLEAVTGTATAGPADSSSAQFVIGNTDDNNRSITAGDVYQAAAWSRALPASERQWLAAEPYAMLRPIVRRRYFVPPAGAFRSRIAGGFVVAA